MLFWGNRAAGAGGTSRRRRVNRPLVPHQPIPLANSKNPKGKPGWGMIVDLFYENQVGGFLHIVKTLSSHFAGDLLQFL